MSEGPGQSGHALPARFVRIVPKADFAEVGTRCQTSCQTGRLEFMMPWLRNGCDLAMCAVLLALTRVALASPHSDLIGTATTYATQRSDTLLGIALAYDLDALACPSDRPQLRLG
jgi:hypothetical protein